MDKQQEEQKLYEFWQKSGFFKADPTSQKKPYSLLIPPPNVNGELHLGHAMQQSILDATARFKRMQGFDVLLLPGVDHAGIIFESTLNKNLSKEGLTKQKLGREEWMKRAWKFKEEIYNSFHNTWTFLGISADWDREVFTLEPKIQRAMLKEFQTFWEQDLLYKGAYIVQWCPKCGTAIEDVEMEYEERREKLYFVKYQIEATDEYITVATARPETIFADTAIATYPKHPKFAKFIGKKAINPLNNNNKLPIIEDNRVEKDFGTGALKITPGHDPLDYKIGQEHGFPILHAIDKTGRMTDLTKELTGLKIDKARTLTAQKLELLGALEKVEDYTHSVPVCERCKTIVEPLISEEWFVKMKPLAQKALKNIGKINFLPKNYNKIIGNWLIEIHDWSISRSLWWGHRIPVWYCQECNPNHKVGKNEEMIISLEKPQKGCTACDGLHWIQDDQVLDTWFSSGLWPIATLGWPDQTKELDRYFPWNFELTAPEIKYLWIARQIMLSLWFKDNIPFKNMFFHGTIRDIHGQKFSKSLGNGINPYDLVNQWGVDATRMALYSYSAPGRDGRVSRQIMDERCKNYRNFATKLRNIYRFTMELKPEEVSTELNFSHPDDKWVKEELDKTIKMVTKNLEEFQFHLATEVLYEFIWHQFADVYIEKAKSHRAEAQPVLEYVLKTSLELLHPFMPYITEELWQKLPHEGPSIMVTSWPQA